MYEVNWMTMEDDCKKTTELMSSVHVSGLLQEFSTHCHLPKGHGQAGSFIGWVQLIPKPPKILPRLGTCDSGEEQPEVKVLTGRRVDKVHPADDVTLTMWFPLLELLLPNKALRKVMIGDVICTLKCGMAMNHSVRGVFLIAS